MYYSICSSRLCLALIILKLTHGYVLLAANLDDFKTLAKKLVPEKLAMSLTQMATASGQQAQDQFKAIDRLSHAQEKRQREMSSRNSKPRENLNGYSKLSFEDLVQKVKERLEVDMMKKIVETVDPTPVTYPKRFKHVQNGDREDISTYTATTPNIYDVQPNIRNKNVVHENYYEKGKGEIKKDYNDYSEPKDEDRTPYYQYEEEAKEGDVQNDYNGEVYKLDNDEANVKRNEEYQEQKYTNDKQYKPDKHYYQEQTNSPDLGEMAIVEIGNMKNDSYEDYVTPKREENIFETEEETTKRKKNNIRVNTLEVYGTVTATATTLRETPKIEYESEKEYVNPEEVKAKTESLVYDYRFVNDTEDNDEAPQKGTMIPKRDFYRISSPNYAVKVPIVAEKYDFNEPIPEKDREPENLKPLPTVASAINGKIKSNWS